MRDYFRNTLNTISDSFEHLDEKQYDLLLEQCYLCIKGNGKIIASGLGKNVPICEKFVGTLNSLGIPAVFLHTNTAFHGDLGIVYKNDLLILLSKSGNTSESIDLARHLLGRGVNAWIVSFDALGRLSEMMKNKLILELDDEGDKWNIVPNNSTSIYLILLQGIAINLAERLDISLETFKRNHPGGSIGEQLKYID